MNKQRLMTVLLSPRITEKSTLVGDKYNQFVFKVATSASKPEIKQAVEHLFEVKVDSVQICNVKGKSKNYKNSKGHRSNWKKAYVKLMPGFDIDFISA